MDLHLQSASDGWEIPDYNIQFTATELAVLEGLAQQLSPEDYAHMLELWRCRKSERYWVDTYLYIKTAQGFEKWVPYKWQYRMLHELSLKHNIMVLKSRQVGCSWVGAAHALWLSLFFPDQACYFYSQSEKKAKTQLGRVKDYLLHLPLWMKSGVEELTLEIRFTATRSTMYSLPAGKNTGRGETANFILTDEMAFWDHDAYMWAGIAPTISAGGVCFCVSTPPEPERGETVYMDQLERINKGIAEKDPAYAHWRSFTVHYSECRGKDAAWVQQQKANVNQATWDREYELALGVVGFPFFAVDKIHAAYKPELKSHVRHGPYFNGVDTSELKKGKDLCALQALTEDGIQVDVWHSNPEFPMTLSAWAGVDAVGADIGKVPQWILDHPGITYIEKNAQGVLTYELAQKYHDSDHQVLPWATTQSSRNKALNELALDIEQGEITLTDEYTKLCLINFVQTESGKPVAAFGWKDDPVIALALANQARHLGKTMVLNVGSAAMTTERVFQDQGSYQGSVHQRGTSVGNAPVWGGEERWHSRY